MMPLDEWLTQCRIWAKNGQWDLIRKSAAKRRAAKKQGQVSMYDEAKRIFGAEENR